MTGRSVRFPSRRIDGTFVVDVVVRVPHSVSADMGEWLEHWVASNLTWRWETDRAASGEAQESRCLQLSKAFDPLPRVHVIDEDIVHIRLFGTREAVFWRDWVARLLQDAEADFGTVEVLRVKDAQVA